MQKHIFPAKDVIRAFRMLTPAQVAEHEAKIIPAEKPILFPCPPECPPANG